MRRWFAVTALAGVLVTAAGCASVFRAPKTIERMDSEIQALRDDQSALRGQVDSLQAAQKSQSDMLRQNHADYQTRLADISETLSTLQSQLEEVTRRTVAAPEPMPPPPEPSDTTATGEQAVPPGERPDPNRLYETAYLDVNQRNYAMAIDGFRTYLRYYPNTELSDNAQYWIGESYYAMQDYAAAILEFQALIEKYPKGDKAASALLRLGDSHKALGDSAQAKASYEQVIREFPKSDEARVAKDHIVTLDAAP